MKNILISANALLEFTRRVLIKNDVRADVAGYVANGLVQTSVRGVDSHGIRLLPHYIKGAQGGRINTHPKYAFKKTSLSTGLLDADHTFGHASGMEAAKRAIGLARKAGTGHVAVYNSTHFGAAAFYTLEIAKHNMIGMSFTNTDALIRTYGGKRPFLGNNPICVAVPCEGEEPFCLDMATSIVTFNKIRQLRSAHKKAPAGAGADKNGRETTDPDRITMLEPVGGYKGYGLSMVVEILCSLFTGMPYGPHIPKMFEAPMSARRYLGHFVSAIRIDCFQDTAVFKKRLSLMMHELREEPRFNKKIPIQVAGDPEKSIQKERLKTGIPMTMAEYRLLRDIGSACAVRI